MAKPEKARSAAAAVPMHTRYDELKGILETRHREVLSEVKDRIRDVRAQAAEKPHHVGDSGDTSEVDLQEDIELALIQMKAETLARINEAVSRLEDGTYGHCFECGGEIAEARLRALPFALRCKDCEEARELEQRRERIQQRRGSATLGFDMRG